MADQENLAKKKAVAATQGQKEFEDDEPPQAQQDEFRATTLKLKALEKKKAILNAQLATKKRAANQAKKLAEAKRKLANMQAEVENLQKACEDTQETNTQMPHFPAGTSHQVEAHNLNQANHHYQEQNQHHYQPNPPSIQPLHSQRHYS